jgi:hypothetical protein
MVALEKMTTYFASTRGLSQYAEVQFPALFPHRVFEGNALRILLIEPSLSSLFTGEDLEMTNITGEGVGIDIDPDGFHRITLYFFAAFLRGAEGGFGRPTVKGRRQGRGEERALLNVNIISVHPCFMLI